MKVWEREKSEKGELLTELKRRKERNKEWKKNESKNERMLEWTTEGDDKKEKRIKEEKKELNMIECIKSQTTNRNSSKLNEKRGNEGNREVKKENNRRRERTHYWNRREI